MKEMRKLFLGEAHLTNHLRDLLASASLNPEERRAMEILLALYGGPDERYTNYYGPPGSIPTISYQDMVSVDEIGSALAPFEIAATETSSKLEGRMVFVGYSDLFSPDQPDRFFTVFTSDKGIDLSGNEIMATAFANLLTDQTIRPINATLSIALVLVFGLLVSHLIFWPSAYFGVPLVLVSGAAYIYGAGELFERQFLWVPMATPLAFQLPFAIVAGLLGQYLVERRQKMRATAAIANYLPEHIAKDLTRGRLKEASLNQVVHGVCLATDMSGFSSISENKSPKELASFMNAYFEAIAGALKKCEVDVTEFHADTIMCAWIGEPEDPSVRRKAVRAAIEVVRAIENFSRDDPDVTLTARVGLQDGPFYLGHTGGGGRLSYSILGDPANSAARLESLNKKLGSRILAAGSVVEGLEDFTLRPLGEFLVVGKANALPVTEVIGLASEQESQTEELCNAFAGSLREFLAEKWGPASESFSRIVTTYPQDRVSAWRRG
jgi:adenylate cyclase